MESKEKGSATGSGGTDKADTPAASFCDVCWQRPSHHGMNFRTCNSCGVGVHDECYGIVRDDNGDSAFTCWACQAVGTKVKIRGGKSIAITKRPTACCLCSVDDGMDWPHAMHPVYDKDGLDGRHATIPGTKDTLAWAHSLCAFFLNSSGTTKGCIYGCFGNGMYVGEQNDADDGGGSDDDDLSVNSVLAKEDPNDQTVHHVVFCQGDDPDVKLYTKAIADTQRDLRCFLCGKNDRGTMRVCMQCCANDTTEYEQFRSTHTASLRADESCYQAIHVGCAMWERKKGSVYPYRRVFYSPEIAEGKKNKRGLKPLICNAFCNTHLQDLVRKQIPIALKIKHPPHITVQRPSQRVSSRDLGEARPAYRSRSTLDPRAADPRARLLDAKRRRAERSASESRLTMVSAAARNSVTNSLTSLELTSVTAAEAAAAKVLEASKMPAATKTKKYPSVATISKAKAKRSMSESRPSMRPAADASTKGTKPAANKMKSRSVSESGLAMGLAAEAAAKETLSKKGRGPSVPKQDKRKEPPGKKYKLKPTHLDSILHPRAATKHFRGLDRQDSRSKVADVGNLTASHRIPRKAKAADEAVDDQPIPRKRKRAPQPANKGTQQKNPAADDDDLVRNDPTNNSAPQPPALEEQGESIDPQHIIDEIIEAEKTYHLDQCLKRKKLKWEGAKNFAAIWPSVVETICNKFDYDAERKTDWKSGTHEATVETLWEGQPPAGSLVDGCLIELMEQKKNEESGANGDRLAV